MFKVLYTNFNMLDLTKELEMAKLPIVLFFVFSIVFSSITFAYSVSDCAKILNFTCENTTDCIAINVSILPTEGRDAYLVGDYFHYNTTLLSISNADVMKNFTVSVYNPENATLSSRTYKNIPIEVSNFASLYPNQTNISHDVYPFDLAGVYRIEVISQDYNTVFYHFYPDCEYTYHPIKYTYYFDVMPKWQYEANEKLKTVLENNSELQTKTFELTGKMVELNKRMESLTIVLVVLAFISIASILWEKSVKYWDKILGLEGIILVMLGVARYYPTFDLPTSLILVFTFVASVGILFIDWSKNKFWKFVVYSFVIALYFINAIVIIWFLFVFNTDVITSAIMCLLGFVTLIASLHGLIHRQNQVETPPHNTQIAS